MSTTPTGPFGRSPLALDFPMSLAVYESYAEAQKAVDFLSDHKFPVENCMIVGTELKQVERVLGRLTTGKVAAGGALSGLWIGLFVGLIISLFGDSNALGAIVSTMVLGAIFGVVWALVGYAATRGQRDFTSVSAVVATRYEVLVAHKHADEARRILGDLPGRSPFA